MKAENALKGQSLFEVLTAVGVTALIVVAIVSLATKSVGTNTFSKNKTFSTQYSQDAIEWLRQERDANWTTFRNRASTSTIYCLQYAYNPGNPSQFWSNTGTCGSSETMIGSPLFRREATLSCYIGGAPSATPAPSVCSDSLTNTILAIVTTYWSDSTGLHNAKSETFLTNWRTL